MRPELIHIPLFGHQIPIYGYGLMLVIGFLLAAHLAKFLANRKGIDGELFINAALIALVAGVVGARLSHILENAPQFFNPRRSIGANLWDMINLRSGGLTYYGGFLLAFPCLVIYALRKKIPLLTGMDIIAPCLMIGLGFGRVGCLLNGCCYGARCDDPSIYTVAYPYHSNAYIDQVRQHELTPPAQLVDAKTGHLIPPADLPARILPLAEAQHSLPVLNAQIFSTITALLLAALLVAYFTIPHVPGHVFALMLILEGATRFLLEMLRAEPPVFPGTTWSLSMYLGVVNVTLGILLWLVFTRLDRREGHHARPLPAHASSL